jgi:hypothetical protein
MNLKFWESIEHKLPTKEFYFKSTKLSSLEMLKKVYFLINNIAGLFGSDIFSETYSPTNPVMVLCYFDLIAYHVISIQNIYAFRDDFARDIFCVVTLGMGFQMTVKMYTLIWHREKTVELKEITESFHEISNDRKTRESFEKWILICCHVGVFFTITFYGCALLIFCYPFIVWLFTGEWILHFGFIIPGIDWQTLHGYLLNFAFQTLQIFIVINALFTSTLLTVIFIINVIAQYDALEIMLDELDELALKNADGENGEKIKKFIGILVDGHVKLLE